MRGRRAWVVLAVAVVAAVLAAAPGAAAAGRWPGTRITYADATAKPRLVAEAIRRWNAATGLRLVRARRGQRAQIRILPRGNGCGASAACAYPPPDGRVHISARWRAGSSVVDDPLESEFELDLLVHELGHAIGLDHVSAGCSAMRPIIESWTADCRRLAGPAGSGIVPCAPFPSDARVLARRYGVRRRPAGRCTTPAPHVALVAPRGVATVRDTDLERTTLGTTTTIRIRNTGRIAWRPGLRALELDAVDERGRRGGLCGDTVGRGTDPAVVRPGGTARVHVLICGVDARGRTVVGAGTYRLRPRLVGRYGRPFVVRIAIDRAPYVVAYPGTPVAGPGGTTVGFVAEVDDDGPVTYAWDFGDPSSGVANASSGPAPQHTYAAPGSYAASLRVTDRGGRTATADVPVYVPAP